MHAMKLSLAVLALSLLSVTAEAAPRSAKSAATRTAVSAFRTKAKHLKNLAVIQGLKSATVVTGLGSAVYFGSRVAEYAVPMLDPHPGRALFAVGAMFAAPLIWAGLDKLEMHYAKKHASAVN